MRRSLVTLAGPLLLGLGLTLSARGVELERCDASRQSCASLARTTGEAVAAASSACEARPHEIDVRSAEAALRRARAALAARVSGTSNGVVPLGNSGYNYAPLPLQPHP